MWTGWIRRETPYLGRKKRDSRTATDTPANRSKKRPSKLSDGKKQALVCRQRNEPEQHTHSHRQQRPHHRRQLHGISWAGSSRVMTSIWNITRLEERQTIYRIHSGRLGLGGAWAAYDKVRVQFLSMWNCGVGKFNFNQTLNLEELSRRRRTDKKKMHGKIEY